MAKKHKKQQCDNAQRPNPCDEAVEQQLTDEQQQGNAAAEGEQTTEGEAEQADDCAARIAQLEKDLEHEKKEYLFLMSDFENFRRRTVREKADLIKNGAESAMRDLLPVVDDLERALDAIDKGGDIDSLKEGVKLIYSKFERYLASQHVTPIDSTGKDFDTDLHEAVTMFPAPDPSMKGKVIDTTIKGYMINDKVLRHAKVVVGS